MYVYAQFITNDGYVNAKYVQSIRLSLCKVWLSNNVEILVALL